MMNRLTILILVLFTNCLSAQKETDSLKGLLQSSLSDTQRVSIFIHLAEQIDDEAEWTAYNDSAFAIASKNLDPSEGRTRIFYKQALSSVYNNKGFYCENHGNIEEALKYYQLSLKLGEELNDLKSQAEVINNIAMVYRNQEQYQSALKYLNNAAGIFQKISQPRSLATVYNNMGHIYQSLKQQEEAARYFRLSMQLRVQLKDSINILNSMHSLVILFYANKMPDSAFYYTRSSVMLAEKLGSVRGKCVSYTYMGQLYLDNKENQNAEIYAVKALELAKQLGYPEYIKRASLLMTEVYLGKKDYKNAFNTYKEFILMRDSITNAENKTAAIKQELKNEYEKEKLAEQKEQEKREIILKEEKNRKNVILGVVSLVGILVLVFSMIVFKRYKITQAQKSIIEIQKHEVEDKNKEITDSINYAKRIQEAALPAKEVKYKLFSNAFVLFQPRDIVSGDFYWFAEKNGKRIIAAVDCTGHGVPGAFMSLIGNTFLNEIVNTNGVTEPASILNQLRSQIIHSLKQSGGENKDGMDVSILSFNDKNNSVEFSGANNPLWLIRNGECLEYKGDKQPVGFYPGEPKPFTNQIIETRKGDTLYIFTDGFADQFGGEKGKKFKYRSLQELLVTINDKPMEIQEKVLLEKFRNWKGNLDQVDDVCIIGIRI